MRTAVRLARVAVAQPRGVAQSNFIRHNHVLAASRHPSADLYGDDENDRLMAEERLKARTERRLLSRSNLLAEHYADLMRDSTLMVFVHGDLSHPTTKEALKSVGFSTKRIKSSLVKVAAMKLDSEAGQDSEHINFASRLSRGITSIAYTKEPLLNTLQKPTALEDLEKVLPMKDPKDGIYSPGTFLVVGGFIKDHGKVLSNIWVTRPGLQKLFGNLSDQIKSTQGIDLTDRDAHTLFHANAVASLQGQLGAIRAPLTRPANAVVSRLRAVPANVAMTLGKVKTLKESEDA